MCVFLGEPPQPFTRRNTGHINDILAAVRLLLPFVVFRLPGVVYDQTLQNRLFSRLPWTA